MTPSVIQWREDVTAVLATVETGARTGVMRVTMARAVTRLASARALTTSVTRCWAASASRDTPAPTAPPPPPSPPCGPTPTWCGLTPGPMPLCMSASLSPAFLSWLWLVSWSQSGRRENSDNSRQGGKMPTTQSKELSWAEVIPILTFILCRSFQEVSLRLGCPTHRYHRMTTTKFFQQPPVPPCSLQSIPPPPPLWRGGQSQAPGPGQDSQVRTTVL